MEIKKLSKPALIVFLLWAFAPLAWFLLWTDKKYHSWFPKLMWVNGIIFAVIFSVQSFGAMPKLTTWFESIGVTWTQDFSGYLYVGILLFAIFQIPLGVYLEGFIKRHIKLTDEVALFSVSIFAIDGLLALATGLLSLVLSPTVRLM
jgi:hypothetical protein